MEAPDGATPLGMRDRCLLEVIYATGLRASELLSLTTDQVDWTHRVIYVVGKGQKERLVLLGDLAMDALERYVHIARPQLLRGRECEALFVSHIGRPLSVRVSVAPAAAGADAVSDAVGEAERVWDAVLRVMARAAGPGTLLATSRSTCSIAVEIGLSTVGSRRAEAGDESTSCRLQSARHGPTNPPLRRNTSTVPSQRRTLPPTEAIWGPDPEPADEHLDGSIAPALRYLHEAYVIVFLTI